MAHITAVANGARADFEHSIITEDYIRQLVDTHLSYLIEALGNDLDGWIRQTLDSFPTNACEIAAAVLVDRLGEGEIVYGRHGYDPKAQVNMRRAHTFWAQRTGGEISLIADITADQFGGPKVYVGQLVEPWSTADWTRVPG